MSLQFLLNKLGTLKEINRSKRITFILTTHDISDIENLCDNVTVINLKGFNIKQFNGCTAEFEIDLTYIDIQSQITKLFNTLPVNDIVIQNIEVEEVIKQLYRANSATA